MTPTHAYIGVKDGICNAITADTGDERTAKDVARMINQGCSVERVTIELAREALFEAWPRA